MPELYYKDALKAGMKEYRECVSKGEYPYLPVLEDFVGEDRMALGTDLGLVQIPADFIVGTRTRGRTHAFARNFMPLLEGSSEFSNKWEALCRAHLSDGIRDPIKAVEYMNRYYVVEGNKRVSVLKFFGAAAVAAQVTRVLPERSEQTEGYFEYVDFYRLSGVNYLEFSKRGSYAQLQTLLGKEPKTAWTEDERRQFSSAYFKFRGAYESAGGKKGQDDTTTGDALLSYVKIYGFQALVQSDPAALKRDISKMWEELELQKEEAPIELKAEPGPGEERHTAGNLLSKVLPVAGAKPKVLRAAFLYDKTAAASGWNMAHELGRRYVQRVFDGKLLTTAYENVLEEDPQKVLDKAEVQRLFNLKSQKQFEDQVREAAVTRAERAMLMEYIKLLGVNDYHKIRFCERYTGLKFAAQ